MKLGRPKDSPEERRRKEEERLYQRYLKSYEKAQKKYNKNLNPKLTKDNFLYYYEDMKRSGSSRPIYNIVSGQRVITERQDQAWVRNLKRNIKKWKTEDESKLSEAKKKILELVDVKDLKRDYFYRLSAEGLNVYNYILNNDAWEEAVGS